MKKIMLDTNIFGRPYDDIGQERIRKEAAIARQIFQLSVQKKIVLVSSDVLFAEISLIKDEAKKEMILTLVKELCFTHIVLSEEITLIADKIYLFLNDYMDALHVAFCAMAECDYFITCDDEITKNALLIEKYLTTNGYNVKIRSPEIFAEEL